jgi:hypothetical protein
MAAPSSESLVTVLFWAVVAGCLTALWIDSFFRFLIDLFRFGFHKALDSWLYRRELRDD